MTSIKWLFFLKAEHWKIWQKAESLVLSTYCNTQFFFVFFTFQHCEVIGRDCRWCQHLTVGKLDRFKWIFLAMLLIWTDISCVSCFSLMRMTCTNVLFFLHENMSKSTRSYIWLVLAIDTVDEWITGFGTDLHLHARDPRESCYCRKTLPCRVSVPWVPILWMERDWLHFVSHAVMEGSRIQTTTTLHLGDSSQAETLTCLNIWEVFLSHFFFLFFKCDSVLCWDAGSIWTFENVYVNPIWTSFA